MLTFAVTGINFWGNPWFGLKLRAEVECTLSESLCQTAVRLEENYAGNTNSEKIAQSGITASQSGHGSMHK